MSKESRSQVNGAGEGYSEALGEISQCNFEFFCSVLEETLLSGRDFWTRQLGERLAEALAQTETVGPSTVPEADWLPIVSLSALRRIVGGRFELLRKRWLAAGLPLSRPGEAADVKLEINSTGWLELSGWLHQQGFEARMVVAPNDALFELREKQKRQA